MALMSRSVKSGRMSASKLVSLVMDPREGLMILIYRWFCVQQVATRNSRVDERERLEIVWKQKSPAVPNPRAEIVCHDVQRRAQGRDERVKNSRDILSSRRPRKDSRVSEARQIGGEGLKL